VSEPNSEPRPPLPARPEVLQRHKPLNEKGFYLEEFYGKGLLFALIPPTGQRLADLDALARALRELVRNQTRCILIAAEEVLPRVLQKIGRMAPRQTPPIFDPARGLRTRPYPPDSAVTQIWRNLRAGRIAVAGARTADPEDLTVFAQEMASRLDVFKLILLDRQGGLTGPDSRRISFVQIRRINSLARRESSKLRRVELRGAKRALEDGVNSVNLTAPRSVYDELFSFAGTGTLFTKAAYGSVKQIALEDFEEAEAMIRQGQNEGLLLLRTEDEIAQILPSCFGYRVADEHLAGICSLLTEPYHRERAGELTALYTLTRFQGEGVGVDLVHEVLQEAQARKLHYVFACTSEERAARFFKRLKFRKVTPQDVPAAKWRDYNRERIKRLSIFRIELPAHSRAR
jgi:amino-acid N-acetyltransferase